MGCFLGIEGWGKKKTLKTNPQGSALIMLFYFSKNYKLGLTDFLLPKRCRYPVEFFFIKIKFLDISDKVSSLILSSSILLAESKILYFF